MEDCFGPLFGLTNAPFLCVRPLDGAGFSMTRLQYRHHGPSGREFSLPAMNAYLLMLYLQDAYHCDLAADGTTTPVRRFREGSLCIIDLSQGASFRLHSDLNSIAFCLPHDLLEEVTELPKSPPPAALRCRRGDDDDVMRNLAASLLPLIDDPDEIARMTVRHVAVAICAHLLQRHAEAHRRAGGREPLSIWQEKDAKDFIIGHFASDLQIADVAASIGLAPGPFTRAFKAVTGVTPHRWLIRYRVGRARRLLAEAALPLDDVARRCGFADKVAMTREFVRETGRMPASAGDHGLH
ncbi:L-rhamnose operon regulatory protein RhaS [Hartmannibacter diazotrophicus]|uniref:L-rhamnose operon regulatory protein RhaS n=1 Tax=Hartmannibacter diazotrophicus TaxID=1482074 RepID=A0A2C9D107_9HYPH|nr:AraC family transcriptional regulator [Hartmannibacter diazotrophicus]SON54002.1 L-rhamnose operon regulatory protein RhaS [Hartmannibacter diazotrophicus]